MSKKHKAIIVVVCEDHREYEAIYPPKNDCIICWKIYATRMKLANRKLRKKLKELKNARK